MIFLSIHGSTEFIAIYPYYYALKYVYMCDIRAIFLFLQTPIVAFVSILFFGEKFQIIIILIVIVDFVGVVLITQPSFIFGAFTEDFESMNIYGLILGFVAIMAYCTDILVIGHNPNLHWLQLQFNAALQAVFLYSPILLLINSFYGDQISSSNDNLLSGGAFEVGAIDSLLCIIIGALSVVNNICFIFGYQMGAASKVVWLEYIDLVFAYSIQWALFNEITDNLDIIGAILISSTFLIQLGHQLWEYRKEKNEEEELNESLLSDSVINYHTLT